MPKRNQHIHQISDYESDFSENEASEENEGSDGSENEAPEEDQASQYGSENEPPEEDRESQEDVSENKPEMTVKSALKCILQDENVDYQEIARELSSEDSEELLNRLLEKNLDEDCFDSIKNLADELYDVFEEYPDIKDTKYLNANLKKAVDDEHQEKVGFFLDLGADKEDAIYKAIENDSSDMLEALEAAGEENFEDYVNEAAEDNREESLYYFLDKDFSSASEAILIIAAKNNDDGLVKTVCDYASKKLYDPYDLIMVLVDNDGEELISEFFKYFDLNELLLQIKKQDQDNKIYQLTLRSARDYLLKKGDTKEIVDATLLDIEPRYISDFSIYPQETKFSGDPVLAEIRKEISEDKSLGDENRLASNIIGIPFCSSNRYLTKSPYHPCKPTQAETYPRSGHHPWMFFVNAENVQYKPIGLPESKAAIGRGNAANLGLYRNPLDSLLQKQEPILPGKKSQWNLSHSNINLRDLVLDFINTSCKKIATDFHHDQKAILVNAFHNYPCLMVYIKKPKVAGENPTDTAIEGWTQIVISYFVALVNAKSQQAGLDIELTRRASFIFLTPTISACDQSFRLSIGIVPAEYQAVLVECLNILNNVLYLLDNSEAIDPQQLILPDPCFLNTAEYKEYLGEKQLPIVNNLLELVWAEVEKGESYKTGAYDLTRSAEARDSLSAAFYEQLIGPPIGQINDEKKCAEIFLNGLRWGFERLAVKGKSLSFKKVDNISFTRALPAEEKQIQDPEFLKLISIMLKVIGEGEQFNEGMETICAEITKVTAAIQFLIQNKKINGLYNNLELLNELLFSSAVSKAQILNEGDEWGSDSEVEDSEVEHKIEQKPEKHIHGKKIIVQNGMRSILMAIHASAFCINDQFFNEPKSKTILFSHGSYYEVSTAIKKLLKEKYKIKKLPEKISKYKEAKILIYDINCCETNGKETYKQLNPEQLSKIEFLIADCTSATTKDVNQVYLMFKKSKSTNVLFLVGSGLKTEQASTDRNPYGTIRIFAKNKNDLDKIMTFIKIHDEPQYILVFHTGIGV